MLSSAAADSRLTPMSAEQLLAAVSSAHVAGFSGTVAETASLGLPALAAGTGGSSMMNLLSGSHSLRVWAAGENQQRVAMVSKSGEYDVFHNGADVWEWDSASQEATHSTVAIGGASATAAVDPRQLAKQFLAVAGTSTTVSSGQQQKVAGREAYQLVLTPNQPGSRVSSVTLAVDGQTHVPLAVQIFGPDKNDGLALDVSFLDISFAAPAPAMFTFTPPASATVTERATPSASPALKAIRTIGTGWTTVFELPDASLLGVPADALSLVGAFLPAVHGAWGSGHLFDSKLLSGLITDDGRVYVGAVDPAVLYQAATN
jgi:outer membrane lipoprotein-sorting protein